MPNAAITTACVRRRVCICAALFVPAAALAACTRAHEPSGGENAEPVLLGPEDIATAELTTLRTGPLISGTLEPQDKATIRAEAAGSVVQLRAELGDAVSKGQVLARIELGGMLGAYRSAEADVQAAQQALRIARAELERTQRLVKMGARAEQELETDRNAVSAAQARLQAASAQRAASATQLRGATVRSPMRGVISQQDVHEGDVVTQGAVLYTVIDPSSVRLQASVPSFALPELELGTPVVFGVRGRPGEVFRGAITRIAPAADPVTRQIPIEVSIPNPAQRLLAGLFAQGRIETRQTRALAVPLDAVDRSGPSPVVTAIVDGRAQRVTVQTGLVDEVAEQVAIESGLSPGQRVVVGGARDIPAGRAVRILAPTAAVQSRAADAGAAGGSADAGHPD